MDKKRDSKRGKRVVRKKEDFGTDNTGRENKNDEGKKDRGKNDEGKREGGKKDKGKREESKNDEGNKNKSKREEVIVVVNGKRLPMGKFPKKIIKEVVVAMVSSLRGGEEAEEIEINIINRTYAKTIQIFGF